MTDPEKTETSRMVLHKRDIAAIKQFLQQNGLKILKFSVPQEEYERGKNIYRGTFPLYIRKHERSSTVIYVENFLYSVSDQLLTVRVEELLKLM